MTLVKIFLIFCGIWNLLDGIVSIKLRSLGHSWISDLCRLIRALLGLGLILAGLLIK
ncbi:MAG: hypothetical protein M0Q96_04145 [Candidatus Omnitrophica bacterium]|nr:hypothetical protein [Candidatus Omnitrophota bacterium]